MIRRIALVGIIAAVAALLPACGDNPSVARPKQAELGVALSADFGGEGPGTLLAAHTLPTVDRRLRAITSTAARVEYTSTSGIDDRETRVTGTVFAPKGPAPDGGWPVIAIGHATTGSQRDCAPSLSPSLLGLSPAVALLVRAGFVVTVPDYQGLGSDYGYHPYLEPTTAGYNVIDAARAARKLVPEASDRWAAVGVSQGGQAAWAANELAATYGAGTVLLGSVSLAPPLDLTFLVDTVTSGTLNKDQVTSYLAILATLKHAHPELILDDYRRGIAEQEWDVLLGCDATAADARAQVIDQITADDLRPSSQAAADTLREYVQQMSLPRQRASAPMLVLYAGKDDLIPPRSTMRALAKACRMGDVIDIQEQVDKGHDDLDLGSVLTWVNDRFGDVAVNDSCAAPPPEIAEAGA